MGGVPDLMTVPEAARVMRIGRTRSYEMAREFVLSNGASGLPVVRVGRMLRVPRQQFEEWLGIEITEIPAEPRGLSSSHIQGSVSVAAAETPLARVLEAADERFRPSWGSPGD